MKKDKISLITWLIFLIMTYCCVISVLVSGEETVKQSGDVKQQIIDRNGSPLLVSSYRIGDDVEPKRAMTYCQLLPVKRSIEDDQIYCYTVVE